MRDNMFKKFVILVFTIFAFGFVQVVNAGDLPTLSVAVSTTELEVGGNLAYTIVYENSTGEDFSNVVVSMDLPVGSGINFVSSSLPEFWSGSSPYWRLGDLTDGSSSSINFVVNLSDSYAQDTITTSVALTGEGDSGSINVGAGSATVSVDNIDEDQEDEEEDDKDEVDEENIDEDTEDSLDKEESEKKEIDFDAKGVESIDLNKIIGGADESAYAKNINEWDNRFLIIGLVSFGLILIIGLVAYFLGKKSK